MVLHEKVNLGDTKSTFLQKFFTLFLHMALRLYPSWTKDCTHHYTQCKFIRFLIFATESTNSKKSKDLFIILSFFKLFIQLKKEIIVEIIEKTKKKLKNFVCQQIYKILKITF